MSMLHCFFIKAFKPSKCATLLKLTISRIKLLRNRREVQLKQMRHDIAKLLETGQEAKTHIKVEHVIREENMMVAQDIIQLFCELIVLRLPIIQSQRECPLDLKEAISSVCFAAPRCTDLPELLKVQLLFATKYGKTFVSTATGLATDCSVNRQLIELLSVQAPSPEKKLNLLKEVAVEHKLDWDPTASETELFKKHEDLLNGSIQFFSESKLPLHEEKHNELCHGCDFANKEQPNSDSGPTTLESSEVDVHSSSHSGSLGLYGKKESKQFVPFFSSNPSISSSELFYERCSDSPPPSLSGTRSESKLTKKNSEHVSDDYSFENPFYVDVGSHTLK